MSAPKIDFGPPEISYIEWHVIDAATHKSIERVDEPDHALSHRAVTDGTAYVVEATVQGRIVKHRIVDEDSAYEDEE